MLCGGTSESKTTSLKAIQHIVDMIKDEVLKRVNADLGQYEVVSYKTQVVAGTNYFIQVKVGENNHIHLRVHRPLPPNHETYELHSLKVNKTDADELTFF